MSKSIQQIRPGLTKIVEPWIPTDGVRKTTTVSVTKVYYETNEVEFEIVSNHIYVAKFHGRVAADVFLSLAEDAIKLDNCRKNIVGDKDGHLVYSEGSYINVPHYQIRLKTSYNFETPKDITNLLPNSVLKFIKDSNFKVDEDVYIMNIECITITKVELDDFIEELKQFGEVVDVSTIS